jgi:hypothetical protein
MKVRTVLSALVGLSWLFVPGSSQAQSWVVDSSTFSQYYTIRNDVGPTYTTGVFGDATNDFRPSWGDYAVVDVNGDGLPDVVFGLSEHIGSGSRTSDYRSREMAILINQGNGTFASGNATLTGGAPTSVYNRVMAVADFNGDGKLDVYIGNHGIDTSPFPGETNGLLLSSAGSLVNRSTALPQDVGFTHSLGVGAINGDGIPHIFVGNLTSASPSYLLLNDGTGNFTLNRTRLPSAIVANGGSGYQLSASALADVNGDGYPDLILGGRESSRGGSGRIYLNDRQGSFANSTAVSLPLGCYDSADGTRNTSSIDILPIDINGDGAIDLLISQSKATPYSVDACLQILVNDGSGNFTDESVARGGGILAWNGGWIKFIKPFDFNRDGHMDLMIMPFSVGGCCANRNRPIVLINNGSGAFTSTPTDFFPLHRFSDALGGSLTIQYGPIPIDMMNDGRVWFLVPYRHIVNPPNPPPRYNQVKFAVFEPIATYPTTVAVKPQTGWWWNSAESGRGFSIEQRGNNAFLSAYLYASDGSPLWLISSGAVAASSEVSYAGTLLQYENGQTLSGAHRSPRLAGSPGSISLRFGNSRTGTLTWPGGTIAISRYNIVSGGVTQGAPADAPESGWWWNASESGRGFFMEIQGSTMFLSAYMYGDSGQANWSVAANAMTTPRTFQGTLTEYSGGQTLTGTYQAPTRSVNRGTVTIVFTSKTTATMTLPNGTQIPLTRFRF